MDYTIAIAITAGVLLVVMVVTIAICIKKRDRVCSKRCRNWRPCDCFEPKIIEIHHNSSFSHTATRRKVAVERWVHDNSQRKKHQSHRKHETVWRTPEIKERRIDEQHLVEREPNKYGELPLLRKEEPKNILPVSQGQIVLGNPPGESQLSVRDVIVQSPNNIILTSTVTNRSHIDPAVRADVDIHLNNEHISIVSPPLHSNSHLVTGSQQFNSNVSRVSHSQAGDPTNCNRPSTQAVQSVNNQSERSIINHSYPSPSSHERRMPQPSQLSTGQPLSNQLHKQKTSFGHPMYTSSRYHLNRSEAPLPPLPSTIQSPMTAQISTVNIESNHSIGHYDPSSKSIVQNPSSNICTLQSSLSGQPILNIPLSDRGISQTGLSGPSLAHAVPSSHATVQSNLSGYVAGPSSQNEAKNVASRHIIVPTGTSCHELGHNGEIGRAIVQNDSSVQCLVRDHPSSQTTRQNVVHRPPIHVSLSKNRNVSRVNIASSGTEIVTSSNPGPASNVDQIVSRISVHNQVHGASSPCAADRQNPGHTGGRSHTPTRVSGTVVSMHRPSHYGSVSVNGPRTDYLQDQNTHTNLNDQLAGTAQIFTCSESLDSWLNKFQPSSNRNESQRRNPRPPLRTNTFKRPALPLPTPPTAAQHVPLVQEQDRRRVFPVIAVPRNRPVPQSARIRSTRSPHRDSVPRGMSVGRTSGRVLVPYYPRQLESESLIYPGHSVRGHSNHHHPPSEQRSQHPSHHTNPLLSSVRTANLSPHNDMQRHGNRGHHLHPSTGFLPGPSSDSDSWRSQTHKWVYGLPLHGPPPYEPGTFGHVWRRYNFPDYVESPPPYDTIYEGRESIV